MSDEQLGRLKADVHALVTDSEPIVKEFFSDDVAWWHLKKDHEATSTAGTSHSYFINGNRGPERIEKPLRFVLGKLAPILEKNGYLAGRSAGRWREYDRGGNYQAPNGRPYYPFGVEWPKELTPIFEQYALQMTSAEKVLREIASVTDEQKRTAAKKRWDSA